MRTPLSQFVERWSKGCGSMICAGASHICLARGVIPADVLFVGEAPGESEDVVGRPFCGPAGHLLDHIVERALRACPSVLTPLGPEFYRTAFANLVCCIPREEDGGKATEPDPDDILKCSPRLEEFVQLVQPRMIVCVGALPEKWIIGTNNKRHLLSSYPGKLAAIIHPAAILRANSVMQGLMVQRAIVTLTNALEEMDTEEVVGGSVRVTAGKLTQEKPDAHSQSEG